jgi:hypothetical protein
MRGLGAVIMLYVLLVALYLGWAQFAKWQFSTVQDEVASLGLTYTNTIKLKEHVRVLQDQLNLQFAALDSYKAVADNLPSELTLDSLAFDRGTTVRLRGTAAESDYPKITEFNEALKRVTVKGEPLFSSVTAPVSQKLPGGQQWGWSFSAQLKRAETL